MKILINRSMLIISLSLLFLSSGILRSLAFSSVKPFKYYDMPESFASSADSQPGLPQADYNNYFPLMFGVGSKVYNLPPLIPSNPLPIDGVNDLLGNVTLQWSGGDPDDESVTYNVYFEAEDNTPDVRVKSQISSSNFYLGVLAHNTTYYWQIVASDIHAAETAGPVWSFTTATGGDGAYIAAGGDHTCVLTLSHRVKCWGENSDGQLGDGTNTNTNMPDDVLGLTSNITAIALGEYHTCALTETTGVKCWGWNDLGQLGDGTVSSRNNPADVHELTSGVKAIAAGTAHTCALTNRGGVKCWGWNDYGQLGDNTNTSRQIPVDVPGMESCVVAISAGYASTCALNENGGVKCWGRNTFGSLGNGTTDDSLVPVDVSGLTSGVTAIASGSGHTCALLADGGVECWGWNSSGQLGDSTTVDRLMPVSVTGLTSGIVGIAAGNYHSCALTVNGAVKCWGDNDVGQVGDGSYYDRNTPVVVTGLSSGLMGIAGGNRHSCAVSVRGYIKCWGYNYFGQLGDGTNTDRFTPVDVIGFGG
jgi:alpha-tubulin suppressor-like RCC1 family protein